MTTLRLSKIDRLLASRPVNRQAALVVSGGVVVDDTVDPVDQPPAYIEAGTKLPVGEAADQLERTRMSLRRRLRNAERAIRDLPNGPERLDAIRQRKTLEDQLKASREDNLKLLQPFIVAAAEAMLEEALWQRVLTAARLRLLETRMQPRASRAANHAPGRAQ